MGARDEYVAAVDAAESAPPDEPTAVVAEKPSDVAATRVLGTFPPFEQALVRDGEQPKMPPVLIEGILYETHIMLLSAPSKAGKTWDLIELSVAVAIGGWWMNLRCARRRVLFVDLETDRRSLHKRVRRVAEAMGVDLQEVHDWLTLWPMRGYGATLTQVRDELFGRCEPGQYGLIVIDPAYMVQDGDENNAKDIKEFFALLGSIAVGLDTAVVVSHHHSKGAQGLKASIDRSSGSGVFGRAPDAVIDMTELVLEEGTAKLARESHKLAESRRLSGWRVTFTLREFAPRDPLDVWFVYPLHVVDDTGLLADCRPNYGGLSEARRIRAEEERKGKAKDLDDVCELLMAGRDFILREELVDRLGWSQSTVNRWLDKSKRFRRDSPAGGEKARVVRREGASDPIEVAATGDDREVADDEDEVALF